MTRTLSNKARSEKNQELREQYPELEQRLDAFREAGLLPQGVAALVRSELKDEPIKGALADTLSAMDDDLKTRVTAAAHDIAAGYEEFYESRRRNGVQMKASDAIEGMVGDIEKICNFRNSSPHHRARQGIENSLSGKAQQLDSPTEEVTADKASAQKTPKKDSEDKKRTPDEMRSDARKMATVAGTVAGVGAAAEAAKNWRDRVKKPESRKKALAFAGAAAVTLGAVGASMMMGRTGMGGLSELANKLSGGKISR